MMDAERDRLDVPEKLDFAVRKLYPVRYAEPELYQAVLSSSFAVTELAPALKELLDALDNCVELSAKISPRSRKAIAAFEAAP